ncbi:MacB-like periplasmic core domain protein [uncultured archaeon]|nr:MacB-like periplasmic core domain protein [uncultured archaeon]
MKITKSFKHAFNMVRHSKLRSWLTIIGIVIGVAAVIAIVSLGEGMQEAVNSRMSGLGGDIVTITPGASHGGEMFAMRGGGDRGSGASQAAGNTATLTRTDVQVLRGMPDIAMIDTNIRGTVNVSYLGKSGKVSMTGVDQRVWSQITTSKIKAGRMLDPADQNVVVIGGRLASSYFSQPLGINKMFSIEGKAFRVVGVLDDQSTSIDMPIAMASQVIPDKSTDVYDTIVVKVKDQNQLNDTIINIQAKLMTARHVSEKNMDFSITSNKQMQETMAQTIGSMSAFLAAIAAVSLIVGAIGIANTMFTSVLEKTKEIGIMKAIGARNRDILMIFLIKAALIGLIGGILGVILGAVLSGSMASLIGNMPIARGGGIAIVSLNSVLMALFVSSGAGIIAGIVPAYQASKLKPVDALRYE